METKIAKSRGKSSTKLDEENITTETQEQENTGVVFEGEQEPEEEKVQPIPPKSVKIKMAKNHKCSIGGIFYNLEKGKTYVVPENVKRILSKVGLLLPL